MDQKTREALEGSIRKWEAIVAGTGRDEGRENCPLCHEFNVGQKCIGCPVRERTGKPYCRSTPYIAWEGNGRHEGSNAKQRAQEELDFLKSLRPQTGEEPMTTLRHLLLIKKQSAELACGGNVDVYYPMESRALDPEGLGKIDVALRLENVTCPRCLSAANTGKLPTETHFKAQPDAPVVETTPMGTTPMGTTPMGTVNNPIPVAGERVDVSTLDFGDRPYLWCLTSSGKLIKYYRSYQDYLDD